MDSLITVDVSRLIGNNLENLLEQIRIRPEINYLHGIDIMISDYKESSKDSPIGNEISNVGFLESESRLRVSGVDFFYIGWMENKWKLFFWGIDKSFFQIYWNY